MKKSTLFVGIDTAKGPGHSTNTEVVHLLHPNGVIEILSIHRWTTTIDLSKDAYRVKDAKAPAQ